MLKITNSFIDCEAKANEKWVPLNHVKDKCGVFLVLKWLFLIEAF